MASVKFRFKFQQDRSYSLIKLYGCEWSSLLSSCFATKKTRQVYEDVVDAHETLDKDFMYKDVADKIKAKNPEGNELLSTCHLLFNDAPYDLRSFIVATLLNPDALRFQPKEAV